MEANRKPVREMYRGNIRATIWYSQSGDRRGWYTATFYRQYWKDNRTSATPAFRYDDLNDLRKLARRAHFWIWWMGGSKPITRERGRRS